jgi:hypothetical protein
MLDLPDVRQRRSGALAAVYRYIGKNLKVGAGYNFTDFSDDLTDLSYTTRVRSSNAVLIGEPCDVPVPAERMNLGIRTVGAAYIAEELPEDRRKMGAGLIVALTAVAFALGLLLLPLAEETRGKPLPA